MSTTKRTAGATLVALAMLLPFTSGASEEDDDLTGLRHSFGVPLRAVYASPLQRAVQTAEPVAAAVGQEVIVDPDLMDRDYGPWTGHRKADVKTQFGTIDDAPGVEPWDAFTDRVTAAVVALAERHAGELVAIAAHDATNQAVLGRLFPGRWSGPHAIPQRNGCWNQVQAVDGAWELLVLDALPGDGARPWP